MHDSNLEILTGGLNNGSFVVFIAIYRCNGEVFYESMFTHLYDVAKIANNEKNVLE